MTEKNPVEVVEAYIRAYNDFDFDALESLIHEDIVLTHHNRGFDTRGRQETIELYRGTPAVIPNRVLTNRADLVAVGDKVVVQHALTGTPTVDVPFGAAGEDFTVDLVTVFVVADGRVVSYEDYG
jgi:limonene-1,2-epoxide hydrolase